VGEKKGGGSENELGKRRRKKKYGCDSTHTQTQVAGSSSCLKKEKVERS
jgi:hypothetical protein